MEGNHHTKELDLVKLDVDASEVVVGDDSAHIVEEDRNELARRTVAVVAGVMNDRVLR